ncbi:class I SAM-dependent methyltransferase [Geodermatophilus aquaeductus]|uniref:Methyltransferase domain-containing protein n=1 Tax=Geodermatophilus aquaeductus TaxID=1564161 RepID=A0A521CS09_9ACTN|nr:class I SAM-dependent methyltransferase [Geodermatophilus aquaeductus]SMO62165.1 Methyltransferase domain-containing protein [Geodermatophilus aquaeductus]
MARMPNPGVLAEVLRSGNLRALLRAARDGQAAVRLQVVAAAAELGVLDALVGGPVSTAALADRLGVPDPDLLAAYLRVLAAAGFITGEGSWALTRAGRAVVDDDRVRAVYEGFGGYHTGLYRELRPLLSGGPRRRDVEEQAGVIARLSAVLEPLLHDLLTRTVRERRPRRVLDIGCGAGLHLAAMLEAAPDATGIGVDVDPDAAALARRTLSERGLADRAGVEAVDIRTVLAAGRPGALTDRIDLALLANVVYYVPLDERVELLSAVARLLAPGGALVVVTTVARPQLFSRHLDLLLRAQEGRMELPAVDLLLGQIREAGLQPDPPERIGPAGAALTAVTAIR